MDNIFKQIDYGTIVGIIIGFLIGYLLMSFLTKTRHTIIIDKNFIEKCRKEKGKHSLLT